MWTVRNSCLMCGSVLVWYFLFRSEKTERCLQNFIASLFENTEISLRCSVDDTLNAVSGRNIWEPLKIDRKWGLITSLSEIFIDCSSCWVGLHVFIRILKVQRQISKGTYAEGWGAFCSKVPQKGNTNERIQIVPESLFNLNSEIYNQHIHSRNIKMICRKGAVTSDLMALMDIIQFFAIRDCLCFKEWQSNFNVMNSVPMTKE